MGVGLELDLSLMIPHRMTSWQCFRKPNLLFLPLPSFLSLFLVRRDGSGEHARSAAGEGDPHYDV